MEFMNQPSTGSIDVLLPLSGCLIQYRKGDDQSRITLPVNPKKSLDWTDASDFDYQTYMYREWLHEAWRGEIVGPTWWAVINHAVPGLSATASFMNGAALPVIQVGPLIVVEWHSTWQSVLLRVDGHEHELLPYPRRRPHNPGLLPTRKPTNPVIEIRLPLTSWTVQYRIHDDRFRIQVPERNLTDGDWESAQDFEIDFASRKLRHKWAQQESPVDTDGPRWWFVLCHAKPGAAVAAELEDGTPITVIQVGAIFILEWSSTPQRVRVRVDGHEHTLGPATSRRTRYLPGPPT